MKNPAPYIREALVTLLSGVTYAGNEVPVYEGETEDVPYFIELADQSISEQDTKHSFNSLFEQVIEVVSEDRNNTRKHVDLIGGQVMNLLKPTAVSQGLTGSADFQVGTVKRISQNYLVENSGAAKFINRLILRYQFLIIEK